MRVSVEVGRPSNLPSARAQGGGAAMAVVPRAGVGTNVAEPWLSRARSVPMGLDLRGAQVDEALAALDRYL